MTRTNQILFVTGILAFFSFLIPWLPFANGVCPFADVRDPYHCYEYYEAFLLFSSATVLGCIICIIAIVSAFILQNKIGPFTTYLLFVTGIVGLPLFLFQYWPYLGGPCPHGAIPSSTRCWDLWDTSVLFGRATALGILISSILIVSAKRQAQRIQSSSAVGETV